MSEEPTFEQVLEATAYKGIPHNDARIRCARAVYDHMTEARRTVSGQDAEKGAARWNMHIRIMREEASDKSVAEYVSIIDAAILAATEPKTE